MDKEMKKQADTFQQLIQDCLEAYEMLSSQITVANLDYELGDEEMFLLFSHLHDRFRALAPDWPGILPLETLETQETILERFKRLTSKESEA